VSWTSTPARGAESKKRRSAVIVSNDAANATAARLGYGVLTVVPVTSNVERVYPSQVFLPAASTGLTQDSKAQAEQLRAVAWDRIGERLGCLERGQMEELDRALRLHLAL
jgi:mRNA interferase MazF